MVLALRILHLLCRKTINKKKNNISLLVGKNKRQAAKNITIACMYKMMYAHCKIRIEEELAEYVLL